MKPIILVALVIASLGPVAAAQDVQAQYGTLYPGNPVELAKVPEAGLPFVSGGEATTGPNSRNQAVSPIPESRNWNARPNEAQLPIPEIRPVPGPPPPQVKRAN